MSAGSDFGTLLLQFRLSRGWTQEELAERSGLSTRGISDLERGIRLRPYRVTVDQLAGGLGLTATDRHLLETVAASQRARPKLAPASSSLPVVGTPIVGRSAELATATALFGTPDLRLLTVVGSGGVGKTRFAIELSHNLAELFPDGVVYLPLAEVQDPKLVRASIARALGIAGDVHGSKTALLQHRHVLLVLDNFEHIHSAASVVAQLLASQTESKVLITSRRPLRIAAEQVFELRPFDVEQTPRDEDSGLSDAVQLFSMRATAISPDFRLTSDNRDAIASIARQLDGLPLAIELAAARVNALSPAEIAARLKQNLPLLVSRSVDTPERHRSLSRAISWSYELLDEPARAMFRRLSLFVGGFGIDAAMIVGEWSGVPDALEGLTTLIDHSLVRRSGNGRYSLLETIRDFGLLQLTEAGEQDATESLFVNHFADLVLKAGPELTGKDQNLWYDRLTADHANIRQCITRMLAHDPVEGLRLAARLNRFWEHRGNVHEGKVWLESALREAENAPDELLAEANWGLGGLHLILGDQKTAKLHFSAGLQQAQRASNIYFEAFNLNGLGSVETMQNNPQAAVELHRAALNDMQRSGDEDGIAAVQNNLATDLFHTGDYEAAVELFTESLAQYRRLRSEPGIASCLRNLSATLIQLGQVDAASNALQEAVELAVRSGNRWYEALAREELVTVAMLKGEWYEAAHLLATVDSLLDEEGLTLPAVNMLAHKHHLTKLRNILGEQAIASVYEGLPWNET